ncbi:MAG: hypothetical protein LBM64_02830 [Deltaproteobacteria bacterium]|jgi:hypothetical protein|nr:hypothetical protein [Deltaproteobacteria bacterium]
MQTSRLHRYLALAAGLFLLGLALFINRGLAGLANDLLPGSALWAHLALLGLEALALVWFWRGLFGRRRYLLLRENAGERERAEFTAELTRRLRLNPHLEHGRLDPEAPGYLGACLAQLKEKADEEIKRAGRRVFLGTALSQNGRLDGLIMLLSLCRLVWRVSLIYNQRPHPREVASLFRAVAAGAFLALSIEELDLSTEISVGFGESLQAALPAAAAGSLPFVGTALQTFTASAIDGAANCFLALRAGIIARNAYMYSALDGLEGRGLGPGRLAVFREAGGLLLSMSGELMDKLARSLASGLGAKLGNLGRYAQDLTAQAGKGVVNGVVSGVSGVADGVSATGRGIAKTVTGGVEVTGKVTGGAARLLTRPFRRKKRRDQV